MENSASQTIDEIKVSKPELPKVKVFQTIQRQFAILGINSDLIDKPYPFNRRIFIGFLILYSAFSSYLIFIIYEADTFYECAQSIYFSSVVILVAFCLMILLFRVHKLFKLITSVQNVIETSE